MMADGEEFHYNLYESNAAKNVCIGVAFVFIFLAPPAFIGIIMFENFGSDKKRTIINMMMTSLCYASFEGVCVIGIPGVINLLTGPLPKSVCYAISIMRHANYYSIILFFDTISIMKYTYIFWLQNPAAFHDDFWCFFINLWVHGFGILSQLAWHFTLTRQPIGYYICSGMDPTEYLKTPLKVYGLLEIFSLLLHVFIWIRIKVYKANEMRQSLGTVVCRKSLFLTDVEKMSLTSFGMIITILLMCLLAVINQVLLNDANSTTINEFPYMVNYYVTIIIIPCSVAIISLFMLYYRNKSMRRFLVIEVKELFGKIDDSISQVTTGESRNSCFNQ